MCQTSDPVVTDSSPAPTTGFATEIAGSALWAWRHQARAQAQAAEIDPAEVDWLLQGLCQVDALALRLGTMAERAMIPAQVSLAVLTELWQRRLGDRVPLQQLVGRTPWRTFTLRVSPAVLIPRPETELIIDLAVAATQAPATAALRQGTWGDLGTGSGAIALGLAAVFPEACIVATDLSLEALTLAQQNAQNQGLGDRIQFLQGSWFEPLTPWRGRLAGVVSNPPYIPSPLVPTLAPEVAEHEPRLALDGGPDGLAALRHLVQRAPAFLQPGGLWLVELMQGQATAVCSLLAATGVYSEIRVHRDLAGIERFVQARRCPI